MHYKRILIMFFVCFISLFSFKINVFADLVSEASEKSCNQLIQEGLLSQDNINPFGADDKYLLDTNCVYVYDYKDACTILQLSYDSKSGQFNYWSVPIADKSSILTIRKKTYDGVFLVTRDKRDVTGGAIAHGWDIVYQTRCHPKVTKTYFGRYSGMCPPFVQYKEVSYSLNQYDDAACWDVGVVGPAFMADTGAFIFGSTDGYRMTMLAHQDIKITVPSIIIDEACGDAEDVQKCRMELLQNQTCADTLGDAGVLALKFLVNFLKVVVSIILLVMGTIDFAKAVVAQDEGMISKQRNTFIKRLIIAVIIFLLPSILHMILKIANSVWPIIDDSLCGLF